MDLILKTSLLDNGLLLEYPTGDYFLKFIELIKDCQKNHNGYMAFKIGKPRKPRTTGKNSQNNLFYKLLTEIAMQTGNDIADVKRAVKLNAVKRGYPYRVNKLTDEIIPYSSADVDTVQMSYLIDECYAIGAEYGVVFMPIDEGE